jgi:ligand-binding sensor domain-containing protein
MVIFLAMACEVWIPHWAEAQSSLSFPVRLDSYTINDGLSESAVSAVTEDKYGEMCIGTEKGLDVFDGYDFQHFSNAAFQKINAAKLSNLSEVMQISKAGSGMLFIRTSANSFLFNPSDRSFIVLDSLYDSFPATDIGNILCSLRTSEGNDWMGINNGILIADTSKETFPGVPHFHRILLNDSAGIIALKEDDRHRVWGVTTQNNILVFDAITYRLLFKVEPEAWGLKNNDKGHMIVCAGKNDLWVGTSNGVWHFDGMKDHLPVFHQINLNYEGTNYSNIWVNCLLQDDQGYLWIGTQTNGIFLFKEFPGGQMVGNIIKTPFYPHSLNSNVILCLTEDSRHRIWIGTENGLNKYDPYAQKFTLYDRDLTDPVKELSTVFSIVGTDSLHIMAVSNGQPVLINTITGTQHHIYLPGGKQYYTWFYTLCTDSSGEILAGTYNGLVYIKKKGSLYYVDTAHAPELNKLKMIGTILPASDSMVLFGSYDNKGGVYKWNPQDRSLVHYIHEDRNTLSLCDNNISDIIKDNHGNIWIGTANGISKYESSKGQFVNYLHFGRNSSGPATWVSCLYDDGSYLWIATLNGGLIKFDLQTHAFRRYTMDDGLPDNMLYACMMDDAGHLWISSNNGISEFYIGENKFRNFSKEDGLQSNEFDEMSAYKGKNGDLFFGGIYGINKIDPMRIKPDTMPVPVYVSDMEVLSAGIGKNTFPGDQRSFTFPYHKNMLLFQFSSLNFVSPRFDQYRYRLAGLNNNWTNAGSRRSVIYSDIPPGNYTFQVNAVNEDGVWNKKPYSVTIVINPPFWKTLWFKLLVILIGILILYTIYKLRLNVIKKKHYEKMERAALNQKIVKLEKMALQAQMNPHFIFNSLNSIKAYILSNESDEAVEYLNDFAALIRKILQNSRKEKIPLSEELEAIDHYVKLEERRLKKKIVLQINTDHHNFSGDVMIPPLIIQPFIENAIWHGIRLKEGNGEISITLRQKGNSLLVSIEDNGVGRERAKALRNSSFKVESMGVSITEERLSYFNKSKIDNVEYEDLPGDGGTKVKLWIRE